MEHILSYVIIICVVLAVIVSSLIANAHWRYKPEFIVELNMLTDKVRVRQKHRGEFGWEYVFYSDDFKSVPEATRWVNEKNAQAKREQRSARGWMRVA